MYQHLSGTHTKVPWRRIVCNNLATTKSVFILWLAMWRRLTTIDKLLTWIVVTSDVCLMCGSGSESRVLDFLHFTRPVAGFTAEVKWMIKSSKRGKGRHKMLLMFFAESVYSLWLNRNSKVYNQRKTATELFKEIQFRVASRVSNELSDRL
ncbi:uncharacterized protein [Spinacia oleracea]|uniref:Reverse transcriptase zinc-binding domain-containing protein n=1 Tax=Spinacia oleracea TaxID=3562 RepID=A0ABM3RPX6_SPIOL|nr:uncharacterized protein LOC130471512 [Spinacia oleracea]